MFVGNNNNNNNNNNICTLGGSGETVKHVLYNLLVLVQVVFLCVSAPFLCSKFMHPLCGLVQCTLQLITYIRQISSVVYYDVTNYVY